CAATALRHAANGRDPDYQPIPAAARAAGFASRLSPAQALSGRGLDDAPDRFAAPGQARPRSAGAALRLRRGRDDRPVRRSVAGGIAGRASAGRDENYSTTTPVRGAA